MDLLFPVLGALILFLGLKLKRKNFLIIALWLSLMALVLHYRDSGGEILGSYFNYYHASIYTLNLSVLIITIIYLLLTSIIGIRHKIYFYITGFFSAVLITSSAFLMINLWVNAFFIENRLTGTPILQVATFSKQPYCGYKYVFYKVGKDQNVWFMCPNYYGFVPAVAQLKNAPNLVVKQLPTQLQRLFNNNSYTF
ncbi:MAG: type I secretion system protein LssZ [Tatlockia sp.]|nr:type I secretion system protein LssZ [Tatlockia sp.]